MSQGLDQGALTASSCDVRIAFAQEGDDDTGMMGIFFIALTRGSGAGWRGLVVLLAAGVGPDAEGLVPSSVL